MSESELGRQLDRWLVGLVVFLIALVVGACFLGWTAIDRLNRATCYQLTNIELAIIQARHQGAPPGEIARLRTYASGLRAIVPGCPRPRATSSE